MVVSVRMGDEREKGGERGRGWGGGIRIFVVFCADG